MNRQSKSTGSASAGTEGRRFITLANVQPEVLAELDGFGLVAAIGPGRVFPTLDDAIAAFRATA